MIFINMGRNQKKLEEKKVKFSVSIDRDFFILMQKEKIKKSRLINTLLKNHYGNKSM